MRDQARDPAAPQPAPPDETSEGEDTGAPIAPPTQDPSQSFNWRTAIVPSVFDTDAKRQLYAGEVRRYRVRFRGPDTPRGFRWLVSFESVRRNARSTSTGASSGATATPTRRSTSRPRASRPAG